MRFSIRDILWLTVVVAIAVGWWLSMPRSIGTARVAGTITVGATPLSQGHVLFHSPDGKIVGAHITAGNFGIPAMPTGKYTVTVEGTGVPGKYSSAATSALQVEISEGATAFDFDLL